MAETYNIGDKGPAGGFIFFVKEINNGRQYLEAAPPETELKRISLANNIDRIYKEKLFKGHTKPNIGSGMENTKALLEVYKKIYADYKAQKEFDGQKALEWEKWMKNDGNPNDSNPNALYKWTEFELNGFKDWFVPSSEELLAMYRNLRLKGLGGFEPKQYWSSTMQEDQKYRYYIEGKVPAAIDVWDMSSYFKPFEAKIANGVITGDSESLGVSVLGNGWNVRFVRAFYCQGDTVSSGFSPDFSEPAPTRSVSSSSANKAASNVTSALGKDVSKTINKGLDSMVKGIFSPKKK